MSQKLSAATVEEYYAFNLRSLLDDHSSRVFFCNYDKKVCFQDFETMTSLLEHMNKTHCIENDLENTVRVVFRCSTCFKMHDSLLKLADHVCKFHFITRVDSLELIKHINPKFTRYLSNSKETESNLNIFHSLHICSKCLWSFQTKPHLKQHICKHQTPATSTKIRHKCTQCQKDFSRPSHLKNHLKLHEASEFKIKCEYCPQSFMKYSLLIGTNVIIIFLRTKKKYILKSWNLK